jgi:hypothetical protein
MSRVVRVVYTQASTQAAPNARAGAATCWIVRRICQVVSARPLDTSMPVVRLVRVIGRDGARNTSCRADAAAASASRHLDVCNPIRRVGRRTLRHGLRGGSHTVAGACVEIGGRARPARNRRLRPRAIQTDAYRLARKPLARTAGRGSNRRAPSAREVLPHAPDAWIDHDKTKVGYEIPFNRHFYVFKPPRPLAEIDADLKVVTDRIVAMIGELSK